jgi:hypothetical protein
MRGRIALIRQDNLSIARDGTRSICRGRHLIQLKTVAA